MMKATQKIILSGLVGLAISSAAYADVLVGIAGPTTGSVAFLGEQQEIGAQRAITDINAAGGVLGDTIRAIVVDDACNADQALAAANQLVSAEVVFVNGHICSGTSIAASPIYEEAGIIMMSPASTNPRVTDEGGPNVYRVIGRDDDQAIVAADLIVSEFAGQKLAVIGGTNPYGTELAQGLIGELAKRDTIPALDLSFAPDASSYEDIVDQLVAEAIEVAYLVSNSPSDMGLIALQAREVLPNIQFISADALSGEDFLLVAGEAGVGTLFTFGPDARNLPSAALVTEAIRDEEFFEPSGYTLYSYAVMQAWAQAVEAAGSLDERSVIQALNTNEFDTVIGRIGFNEKGDVKGVDNFVIFEYDAETYSQRP
ncbi:branched-chain amino acid ABC transporter substrate-binding protein [Hoeflea sp. G2-23]|uniref:Branched-chain amino acid ABC transporter substrate-binding protein n=1 Tax=Hoeflea algicola TaxID=2983763 RepID=A0ABT3Z5J5_9HYPH|nr:branched-chain amino acid ABC transporter substrate-binding protein [Hoeflea algicola]MCY0147037.1 branched-chain amino acid ABC transporter substrate-binding protein [Hoeflea algicola]